MIGLKIILEVIRDSLSTLFKGILRWLCKNWFYITLITVAVIGGVCAFLVIPFAVPQPFSKDDSISTLRQAVLVATGGVLAILTLWENRRKNDQEHTRQVHAERRIRYATAVEQLANEKAHIRLGGVYTLVKLIDEWLADKKTLPNKKERTEEGQVIINSLCAYIRSPFGLAPKAKELSEHKVPENYEGGAQQFVKDQARIREEKEIRLTILKTIKTRLNNRITLGKYKNLKFLKGSWLDFDYDFSNTIFFYPADFRYSHFNASSNFIQTTFVQRADFQGAAFTWDTNFSGAEFIEGADFSKATFIENTDFSEAKFTKDANFFGAEFIEGADFSKAIFTGSADFFAVKFTYTGFRGATFTRDADFRGATFAWEANFSDATFAGNTNFSTQFFTKATFDEAKFTRSAIFSGATFEEKPLFEYMSNNKTPKPNFSYKTNPKGYKFEVSRGNTYKFDTEEQEFNGRKFTIPKGAILFDPDDPSEREENGES